MLFGIVVLTWVITATAFRMLAPPLFLLALRESYLDRRFSLKVLWIPAVTTLLAFLYMVAINQSPIPYAALESGKIITSSVILIQLATGLVDSGPSYAVPYLGALLVLVQRCLVLEKRLMANAIYSFRIRRANGKQGIKEIAGLFLGLVLTATSEFLRLADDVRRLYLSRGSNPAVKKWVVPRPRKIPVTVGDIILVVVLALALKFMLSDLLPGRVLDAYSQVFGPRI